MEERAAAAGLGVEIPHRVPNTATERDQRKSSRGTFTCMWLGYADDLVLYAHTPSLLQRGTDILVTLLEEYGLTISIGKTKSMTLNFQDRDDQFYPTSIVHIGGLPIENVRKFTYLGAIASDRAPAMSEEEVTRRAALARARFANLRALLTNFHISLPIRMRFYDVYIRSRLCYLAETWAPTKRQLARLESVQNDILRQMVRGGAARGSTKAEIRAARTLHLEGDDEKWAKIRWDFRLTTAKIREICEAESVSDFVERQNERWIAHCVRMDNSRLQKRLLFNVHKCRRGGNRPKTVYEAVTERRNAELGQSTDDFHRSCQRREL